MKLHAEFSRHSDLQKMHPKYQLPLVYWHCSEYSIWNMKVCGKESRVAKYAQ